jgi:hypothetical protein
MIFSEMTTKDKIDFILKGQIDPYFCNEYNWLSIKTTPDALLETLSLRVNAREREVLPLIKGMYCTFCHTGGYNPYSNFLRTRRFSRFQSISACTVEQFINYKGRQVPNSDVCFFNTASEAIRRVG